MFLPPDELASMQIFGKTMSGKTITLDVVVSEHVQSVKAKILNEKGY